MRKHTNDKELLRPAVTRFATAFLTLQSMYKQKRALEVMFSSDEWVTSAQAKKTEGKVAKRIVVNDPNFWPYVAFCVKSVVPLVSVLREVDSEERPAMDARWTPQLHHPLHAAGYYLNPQLRYEVGFSNCSEVKEGLYACMDRMLSNDDRLAADIQLDNYDNAQGDFGCPMAIRSRKLRSPVNGGNVLEVRHRNLLTLLFESLALRVVLRDVKEIGALLSRYIQKKRNRLEHKRLNALVYVKYNLRLRERSIKRRNKIDPIVVDEIDSDDEWITEKEDPVLPEKPSWLENDDLFSGDPIVSVPSCPFDSLIDFDKRVEVEVVDGDNGDDDTLPPSPSPPRIPQKRITESSTNAKKRRMELIDEDVELEDHGGINSRNFDSGKSATIETIDDDSELEKVFLLCLLAGTSICWFNTVCFVLCIKNFPSTVPLALSLTVSFNGVSAALYNLAATSLNPHSSAVYLLLNALIPFFTSTVALIIPILLQPPNEPQPSDLIKRDQLTFLKLNLLAIATGLYLLLLHPSCPSTACLLFSGAVLLLILQLAVPGIIYARDWFIPTACYSSFHLNGSGFILVHADDLEVHKELLGRPDRVADGVTDSNDLVGKDRPVVLGQEHNAGMLRT
ncbi:hypothetical protein OROMI_008845 [Orobanche minor]